MTDSERIQELENKLIELENKFNAFKDTTLTAIDSMNVKQDDLLKKYCDLQNELTALKQELSVIKNDVVETKNDVSDIKSKQVTLLNVNSEQTTMLVEILSKTKFFKKFDKKTLGMIVGISGLVITGLIFIIKIFFGI